MSPDEVLISLAAVKVTAKLIYQHLINPGDSAHCHAVQKRRPFFSSRQHRRPFRGDLMFPRYNPQLSEGHPLNKSNISVKTGNTVVAVKSFNGKSFGDVCPTSCLELKTVFVKEQDGTVHYCEGCTVNIKVLSFHLNN